MFIDEIHWIPFEVYILVSSLGPSISVPLLVSKHVNVDIDGWLEALLPHPVTTVACELNRVAANFSQVFDDLGAN